MTQIEQILALCGRPEGATTAEIAQAINRTMDHARTIIGYLHRKGSTFAAMTPETRATRRHFLTEAARDAWSAANPPMTAERRRELRREQVRQYDRLRRPKKSKPRQAYRFGDRPGTTANRVLTVLDDAGLSAETIAAKIGAHPDSTFLALTRLVKEGRAFSARVYKERAFFASKDAAATYVAIESEKQRLRDLKDCNERRKAREAAARANRPAKERPSLPAGVTIMRPEPKPAAPQEVDYSRAKITRVQGPAYDVRYQVDPSKPVDGGFRAAGVGRYLEAA